MAGEARPVGRKPLRDAGQCQGHHAQLCWGTWGDDEEHPKVISPKGWKPELLSADCNLILVRQPQGALAPQTFELGPPVESHGCWSCECPGGGRVLAVADGWAVGSESVCFIRGQALGRGPSPSLHPLPALAVPTSPGIDQGPIPCHQCAEQQGLCSVGPPSLPQVWYSRKGT